MQETQHIPMLLVYIFIDWKLIFCKAQFISTTEIRVAYFTLLVKICLTVCDIICTKSVDKIFPPANWLGNTPILTENSQIYALITRTSWLSNYNQIQANFFFRGLLFTSHWLNLQHWTGFYIAVYGDFQGLFLDFRGLFAFWGRNCP